MSTENMAGHNSLILKSISALLAVTACCSLLACGSGSESGTAPAVTASAPTATGSIASGSFVDAPIAGLLYESGSQRGVTDVHGNFNYTVGSPVTFKVGDIVVGSSGGAGVLTPINLAGNGADAESPRVAAMVQFLKSITDEDENGNLKIPESVSAACAGRSINFDAADAEAQVAAMVKLVAPAKSIISAGEAKGHMKSSLFKLAAGTYSGTWTAPASYPSSGSFTVVITQDGNMKGVATLGKTIVKVTSNMTSTLIAGSTYAVSGSISNGATWSGTIDLSKKSLSGKAQYDGVDATFYAKM